MKLTIIICVLLISSTIFSQNVGIGTTTPKARLHIADSAVVFTGPNTLPATPGKPPISGSGTRTMWYPNKGAFRTGNVLGTSWDEANVGNYSAAFGSNNKASGTSSVSVGNNNIASGIASFVAGFSNSVSGNYATALGYDNNATSYGTLSIGRLNIDTGNSSAWVESDPLFTIGNGYTYETSPGVGATEKRNAFEVLKNGNAKVGNDLFIKDRLKVYGNADIDGRVILDSNLYVHGNSSFTGNVAISQYLNVDTINTIKAINANLGSGTMPLMNLVPLGVVKFSVTYNRNGIDQCLRSFTNLAGNFVSSGTGLCDDPFGQVSRVGIFLHFNTAQAAFYKDIIAAPNVFYDGMGIPLGPTGAELTGCGSYIVYDVSDKPSSFFAGFNTEDIPTAGVYTVFGTVMFYGIK